MRLRPAVDGNRDDKSVGKYYSSKASVWPIALNHAALMPPIVLSCIYEAGITKLARHINLGRIMGEYFSWSCGSVVSRKRRHEMGSFINGWWLGLNTCWYKVARKPGASHTVTK